MRPARWVLALALLLGLWQESMAAQIMFRPTTVAALSHQAAYVLEARYRHTSPEGVFEFEPMGGVTHSAMGILEHSTIHVWQASVAAWSQAHRGGVSRSPLVLSLPAVPLVEQQAYLLFLQPGQNDGEYVLTAENAWIATDRLAEVRCGAVAWVGKADDAKAGAVVVTNGTPSYLRGVSTWPKHVRGHAVAVTGIVVVEKFIPDPAEGPVRTQGAYGTQWVVEQPEYHVIAAPTLATFRGLHKGMSMGDVLALVGPPDQDIGSGIYILLYRLADGSTVRVNYAHPQYIHVTHIGVDGHQESVPIH